jgi:hypothetical protein
MRPLDLLELLAQDCGYAIGSHATRSPWTGVHLLLPATDFWVFVKSNADVWLGKHAKSSGTFECNLHDPESVRRLKNLFDGIREHYENDKPKRILCEVDEIDS